MDGQVSPQITAVNAAAQLHAGSRIEGEEHLLYCISPDSLYLWWWFQV